MVNLKAKSIENMKTESRLLDDSGLHISYLRPRNGHFILGGMKGFISFRLAGLKCNKK